MEDLFTQIRSIEFTTGANFSYDLDREYDLISSYLTKEQQDLLKQDFDTFQKIGRFLVLNSFGGGILFLKVPEIIDRIQIEYMSNYNKIIASVIFQHQIRNQENIKYKPESGKTESTTWGMAGIFPNFPKYQKAIQMALMLVIGKIVKRICEYGRTNFAYMKIENEFNIELLIDGKLGSKLNVEIN